MSKRVRMLNKNTSAYISYLPILIPIKGYLFCFLVLILSLIGVRTQGQSIDEVDVMISSPEAGEFAKFGNLDVSMFKGVPNITVPIFELSLQNYTLPIYLSYNAGGVKVDQVATPVGLGWTLHAGGRIDAVTHAMSDVVNARDEPNSLQYFNPNSWYPGGSTQAKEDYDFANDIYIAPGGAPKNTKPDVYFFNYPGKSGKFIKSSYSTFATVPYTNHAITYNNFKFTIADNQGNVYRFDNMLISATLSKNCSGGPGAYGNPSLNSGMIPDISYSWLLTEIETSNGDTIVFEYTSPEHYSEVVKEVQQKYVRYGSNHSMCQYSIPDYACSVQQGISIVNLEKIIHTGSGQEIYFAYNNSRQDYGGKTLDRIVLRRNGNDVKEFNLNHSYFQSSGGSDHKYKRLKLDSIDETGTPGYSFQYNTSAFPPRLSYSQDIWGYYNGKYNSTLVPNVSGFTGGADRSVNTSTVGHWSLTQVRWPTGGTTVFDMVADPAGGGLRVNTIYDLDGMGNTTGLREFSYERATFGNHYFWDLYQYYGDDGTNFITPNLFTCQYNMYTSSSVQPVTTLESPDFGYTKVTVDYETGGESGRTVVEYSGGVDDLKGTYAAEGAVAWGRGEMLTETHYKKEGSSFIPVKKTENTFKVHYDSPSLWAAPSNPHESYIYGLDIKLITSEFSSFGGQVIEPARFDIYKFRVVSAWYHPDSTYTYLYDPNNPNNYSVTKKILAFDAPNIRLSKVTEINSNDTIKETEYKYAHEVYTGMNSSRMFKQLYSVTIKDGITDNILQKRWVLWNQFNGKWRPCGIWVWDGAGSPQDPASCTSN